MSNPNATSPDQPGVLRVLQSKDEVRAFYNKIAHIYDLMAEHSEQPMREAGLELLAAQPGERVLEIGYGTGHCLVSLAEAVGDSGRVLGIDLSDKMQALAEELLAKRGLAGRVELKRGDATSLPYDDASLDGIFTSFTLELFDTPEIPRVLAECLRVLRPEGRMVVVAVSREGKADIMLKAYEWTHKHFPNLMDCRPIYVHRALEHAGFKVDESDQRHMWVAVEIVRGVKAK